MNKFDVYFFVYTTKKHNFRLLYAPELYNFDLDNHPNFLSIYSYICIKSKAYQNQCLHY